MKPSTEEKTVTENIVVEIKFSDEEKLHPELKKGRVAKYTVKSTEQKDHVHVEQEQVQFDVASGVKKSKPEIQIYDTRSWNNFRKFGRGLGYTHIRVLWAPKGVDTELIDPVAEGKKKMKNT